MTIVNRLFSLARRKRFSNSRPHSQSVLVGRCPNNLYMGLLSTVDPGCVYFDLQLWSSLPKQDAQFRRADAVGILEVVVEEASSEGLRLH